MGALDTILLKIGSDSLVDARFQLRSESVERIGTLAIEACALGLKLVVVHSGAVAAGSGRIAPIQGSAAGRPAAAAVGQARLTGAFTGHFAERGLHAAQILVLRDDFSSRERFSRFCRTLELLLHAGTIVFVNENDATAVEGAGFRDNDELTAELGCALGVGYVIFSSEVGGLYRDHSCHSPGKAPIALVHDVTPHLAQAAAGSSNPLGRGGMESKLRAIELLLQHGIPSFLGALGRMEDLRSVLEGSAMGTYFCRDSNNLARRASC
jgi:glutamate 5-kinase